MIDIDVLDDKLLTLKNSQREVLESRFGSDGKFKYLREIAEIRHVSIERIRKIQESALNKLRKTLKEVVYNIDELEEKRELLLMEEKALEEQERQIQETIEDILVGDLDLNKDTIQSLIKSGIFSLKELLQYSDRELKKFRYVKKEHVEEIKEYTSRFRLNSSYNEINKKIERIDELIAYYNEAYSNYITSGNIFYKPDNVILAVKGKEQESEQTGNIDDELIQGKEKILKYNLLDLDLSHRAYNALRRAGIDSVEKLLQCSKDELMDIRNLGKKQTEEIRIKVSELLKKEDFYGEITMLLTRISQLDDEIELATKLLEKAKREEQKAIAKRQKIEENKISLETEREALKMQKEVFLKEDFSK